MQEVSSGMLAFAILGGFHVLYSPPGITSSILESVSFRIVTVEGEGMQRVWGGLYQNVNIL